MGIKLVIVRRGGVSVEAELSKLGGLMPLVLLDKLSFSRFQRVGRWRLIAVCIVVFIGAAIYLAPREAASQPRATRLVSYWVDVSGNDNNPGTKALPFRTIQKGINVAADQNVLGNSVVVNINPGIYSEAVTFPVRPYTDEPIGLVSTTTGEAIIDGSDVVTGWSPYSGSIYSHAGAQLPACECPYEPSECPPGIGMRREMVFVDGELLRQVDTVASMTPGTYAVDEGVGTLFVWTPTGANPDEVTTEVTMRGNLLSAVNTGLRNLSLNGLIVQRSYDCVAVGSAIEIINVPNVVLQDVSSVWNNDEGIFISGATGTFHLTRVHADNNGFIGMGIHNTKNLQATDVTTDGNNWRGKWVNFGGWFTSGVKFGGLHDATITRWTSTDPFWLDTDATRVTVNDLLLHNGDGGLILETLQGPVTFNNPVICQTASDPVNGGSAITVQASQNVSINNAIIFLHNPTAGSLIGISIGVSDPASVDDWETGAMVDVTTKNWAFMHGVIVVDGPGAGGDFVVETDAVKPDFWETLLADFNVYWDPNLTTVWQNGLNLPVDFASYTKWLGAKQEDNSEWARPFSNDPTSTCTFEGIPGIWPR